jgi:hypothetical protein
MEAAPHQVTRLLQEWNDGDESALEQLMPLVHDELRRLAHKHMRREGPGHILQTSALINEADLRFGGPARDTIGESEPLFLVLLRR